jgi:hypothetical protein
VTTATEEQLTTMSPAEFLGYIKFLAKHDLLDDVQEALHKAHVRKIRINPEPIIAARELIEEVLKTERLSATGREHGSKIVEECGCDMCGCNPHDAGSGSSTTGGAVLAEGTSEHTDAGAGDAAPH